MTRNELIDYLARVVKDSIRRCGRCHGSGKLMVFKHRDHHGPAEYRTDDCPDCLDVRTASQIADEALADGVWNRVLYLPGADPPGADPPGADPPRDLEAIRSAAGSGTLASVRGDILTLCAEVDRLRASDAALAKLASLSGHVAARLVNMPVPADRADILGELASCASILSRAIEATAGMRPNLVPEDRACRGS